MLPRFFDSSAQSVDSAKSLIVNPTHVVLARGKLKLQKKPCLGSIVKLCMTISQDFIVNKLLKTLISIQFNYHPGENNVSKALVDTLNVCNIFPLLQTA